MALLIYNLLSALTVGLIHLQ